jgi:hypothetical protein
MCPNQRTFGAGLRATVAGKKTGKMPCPCAEADRAQTARPTYLETKPPDCREKAKPYPEVIQNNLMRMKIPFMPSIRRMLLPVLGLVVMISSTSCIEIFERLALKKDGSGEYLIEMNMGQMMGMIMAFANVADSTGTVEDLSGEYSMDSTMRFADMPDSIKQRWQYPEITKNGSIWLSMDGSSSTMLFTLALPFKNIDDVNKFGVDMATGFSAFDTPLGSDDGDAGDLFPGTASDQFSFKPGQLTRKASENSLGQDELTEEDLEMMKMMLGSATYRVEYVLPGKVKKVDGLNYSISEDGSTVSRTFNFLEMLEEKTNLSTEISYK